MSHDPDELFGAFASASDDSGEDGEANGVASDTDEDVHAEVEQLREENERLRSLLARCARALDVFARGKRPCVFGRVCAHVPNSFVSRSLEEY